MEYQSPVMQDISRQRKLADALRAKGDESYNGQMVGNIYVPQSITQHLARALNPALGAYIDNKADAKEKDYNTTKNSKLAELLKNMNPQQIQNGTTQPMQAPERTFDQFGSPTQGQDLTPQAQGAPVPNMQMETPEQAYARQRQQIGLFTEEYGNSPALQMAMSDMDYQRNRNDNRADKIDERGYQGGLRKEDRLNQVADREDNQEFQRIQMKEQQGFQLTMQEKQFSQSWKMQQSSQQNQNYQNALTRGATAEQGRLNRAVKDNTGAPIAILGKDGQPVYVNRSDAVGQAPYNASATAQGSPQQRLTDSKDVLQILKQAAPLINKSTGSGMGALVDSGAAFFGGTTSGAQNAASLKALEGSLVSKMPKMSGPQSDKDVLLYKQMAGQIGDPTLPPQQKQAAMNTINQLNSRYAGVPYVPLDYGTTQITITGKGGVSKSVYDDADAILGGQ
jgi:hypothetical protein